MGRFPPCFLQKTSYKHAHHLNLKQSLNFRKANAVVFRLQQPLFCFNLFCKKQKSISASIGFILHHFCITQMPKQNTKPENT